MINRTKKNSILLTILLVLPALIGVYSACSTPTALDSLAHSATQPTNDDSGPPAPAPTPAPLLFWLEPRTSPVIGVGQVINIYTALKGNVSTPYPAYVDPTTVTWSNSNPNFASIDVHGVVTGLASGTTTISGAYQGNSSQVVVQVSGKMVSHSIVVGAQPTRTYFLYTPDFGTTAGPFPLVVVMHGGGGTAMQVAASGMMNNLAQTHKFYVAYPEGTGVIQTFNAGSCCGTAKSRNIDDVLFIKNLLVDVEKSNIIDSAKIYASGFSNGAIMSHRLACEMADKFAAIIPFSGGSGEFDFNLTNYFACTPSRPIPIIEFHANNDRNYPIAGGAGNDGSSGTNFYPIQSTINDWISRNNVTSMATTDTPTPTETCYHYKTPANSAMASAPVTLCVLNPVDVYDATNSIVFGGGHSWPGGVRSSSAKSDVPVIDFLANTYIWKLLGN